MEILTHMYSSIGLALIDSLDELVHSGRIEPQLAMKVIATFDKSITEVLADKVKTRLNFKVRASCEYCKKEKEKFVLSFFAHALLCCKGHLDTYRFCDEVWTFLIKDVIFKLDNQNTVQADRIKIVSCNAKRPGET